jgi:hypothetical protein
MVVAWNELVVELAPTEKSSATLVSKHARWQ